MASRFQCCSLNTLFKSSFILGPQNHRRSEWLVHRNKSRLLTHCLVFSRQIPLSGLDGQTRFSSFPTRFSRHHSLCPSDLLFWLMEPSGLVKSRAEHIYEFVGLSIWNWRVPTLRIGIGIRGTNSRILASQNWKSRISASQIRIGISGTRHCESVGSSITNSHWK